MSKIRVTETRIWEYVPDLNDDFYVEHECKNFIQALQVDKKCYEDGDIYLDDLTPDLPETSTTWELIQD